MDALIEKLSAGQIVALVSIIVGAVVALAITVAVTKYQFQALAEDTALRREKQQADLALRERLIERREEAGERAPIAELLALGATQPEPDELNAELAKRFGQLDASAEDIERTLQRALAADRAQKKMIVAVLYELLESGSSSDAILAAIRPLCAPQAPPHKEAAPAGA
jgi:hypothetical protein